MDKPTCLCHIEMVFLMDNKAMVLWQCPNCSRLLLQWKNRGSQFWYAPEGTVKAVIGDKEKQG